MLVLILQWCLLCNPFKLFDKIGLVLKSTFITDLRNIEFALNKQFTGISNSEFLKEPGKCLVRFSFEITAKGRRVHVGN